MRLRRLISGAVATAIIAAAAPTEPVRAAAWSTRAPLPEARQELAVAALDGRVYVIGGFRGDLRRRRDDLANLKLEALLRHRREELQEGPHRVRTRTQEGDGAAEEAKLVAESIPALLEQTNDFCPVDRPGGEREPSALGVGKGPR